VEDAVVQSGDAAFSQFHPGAGDEGDGAGEVGLVADQQHLATAGRQLQGVEVSAGQTVVFLNRAIKGGAGELGGSLGSNLGAREANVQTRTESLEGLAGRAGLAFPLLGQVTLGVGLTGAVLRIPVTEQPDHSVKLPIDERLVSWRPP
jgi:hypothetical protein